MDNKTIKKIRLIAMLTQQEFADVIGVGIATVQRWEWDKGNPTLRHQRKIVEFCKQHNIDLEELKRQANDGKQETRVYK